jgi:hypothetical protein
MNMKKSYLIIILFCCYFSMLAQEEKKLDFSQIVEIGALAGVEISRNTGDFKFAYGGRYTGQIALSDHFHVGIGMAYEKYDNFQLLPIFIDVHAYLKEQVNSPFFAMQIGYAHGWDKRYQSLEYYDFKGGALIAFDYGRRIPIQKNTSFSIALGFRFQQSRIQFDNPNLYEYKEQINMVLLNFKAGIQF